MDYVLSTFQPKQIVKQFNWILTQMEQLYIMEQEYPQIAHLQLMELFLLKIKLLINIIIAIYMPYVACIS